VPPRLTIGVGSGRPSAFALARRMPSRAGRERSLRHEQLYFLRRHVARQLHEEPGWIRSETVRARDGGRPSARSHLNPRLAGQRASAIVMPTAEPAGDVIPTDKTAKTESVSFRGASQPPFAHQS
jgi:hypothetical protein